MPASASPDRDLPLGEIPAGRALACLTGGLVCLGVLAMAATTAAYGSLHRLATEPVALHVVVPAAPDGSEPDALEPLVAVLDDLPGLVRLRIVPPEELMPGGPTDGVRPGGPSPLPLPRMLDVAFAPELAPEPRTLADRLRPLAAGVTVGAATDDRAERAAVARRTMLVGWLGGGLALAGLALGVAAVARWGLTAQREAVRLLRALGASEGHVARQFEQSAARTGLIGASGGFVAAVALLALLGLAGRLWPEAGLVEPRLAPADWLRLVAVPVAAALLAAVAARLAVRVGLARLR